MAFRLDVILSRSPERSEGAAKNLGEAEVSLPADILRRSAPQDDSAFSEEAPKSLQN